MLLFIWCVLLIPLAPVGITVGWYVGKCGGEFFWWALIYVLDLDVGAA